MKALKVIFLSIISIIVLAVMLEGITYLVQSHRLVKEGYRFVNNSKKAPYPTQIKTFQAYFAEKCENTILNNNAGLTYQKRPILIFGDVYANSLDNTEENLTTKLAHYTKRPVYNFASAGWGIQHMYYILKTQAPLNLIHNPEAIIYVYIGDQKNRLNSFSFYPHHDYLYLKYKLDNGIPVEVIPNIFIAYRSYFFRSIERFMGIKKSNSKNPNIQQKNFNLIKNLFEASKNIAQIRFPNLNKFIILRFTDESNSVENLKNNENSTIAQLEYNMWDKLRHEGFIIIDVNELNNNDYSKSEYKEKDSSPKNQVFDEILPALTKRAELI